MPSYTESTRTNVVSRGIGDTIWGPLGCVDGVPIGFASSCTPPAASQIHTAPRAVQCCTNFVSTSQIHFALLVVDGHAVSIQSTFQDEKSQSQRYRERTHEGCACIERSKTDGMKQWAGRCHAGHATAPSPEPPHTSPNPPTRTKELSAELQQLYPATWSVVCRQLRQVPPALQQTTAA
eukprot:363429-Chlamydomonas_euryale.AAC.28